MASPTLPRHLLKWVLSLDLTYPIKHPKRDFANGFLVAELLSKYFPDDIQMHSFENVTSVERKKSNWHLLKKFFKRYDVPVSKQDVEHTMAAADGAVVILLQAIYDYVHEDFAAQATTYEDPQYPQYSDPNGVPDGVAASDSHQEAGYSPIASPSFVQPGTLPYMQQPYGEAPSAAFEKQHPAGTYYPQFAAPQQGPTAGWPQQYPIGSMQYPTTAQQPAYGQQAYTQAQGYSQQSTYAQQPASLYSAQPYSAVMPQHMQTASTGLSSGQTAGPSVQFAAQQQAYDFAQGPEPSMPSIEYDKRPRAVVYKPYTQQDYSSRNYDAKRQDYWKLGTLGPQIEDEDLQAKRRKAEELKELARSIREKNARLASMSTMAARSKVESPKSKSVREKALEFAKNVPKPEMKRAVSTGSSSGESTPKQHQQSSGLTEIDKLQAQHAAHRKKVESIRQEFVRMATG